MSKARYKATLTGKKKASGNTVNFSAEFTGLKKTFADGGSVNDLNRAALAAIKSQNPGIVTNSPFGEVIGLKVLGYSMIKDLGAGDNDGGGNTSSGSSFSIFKKPYWAIPLRLLWNIIKGIFKVVLKANPFK